MDAEHAPEAPPGPTPNRYRHPLGTRRRHVAGIAQRARRRGGSVLTLHSRSTVVPSLAQPRGGCSAERLSARAPRCVTGPLPYSKLQHVYASYTLPKCKEYRPQSQQRVRDQQSSRPGSTELHTPPILHEQHRRIRPLPLTCEPHRRHDAPYAPPPSSPLPPTPVRLFAAPTAAACGKSLSAARR